MTVTECTGPLTPGGVSVGFAHCAITNRFLSESATESKQKTLLFELAGVLVRSDHRTTSDPARAVLTRGHHLFVSFRMNNLIDNLGEVLAAQSQLESCEHQQQEALQRFLALGLAYNAAALMAHSQYPLRLDWPMTFPQIRGPRCLGNDPVRARILDKENFSGSSDRTLSEVSAPGFSDSSDTVLSLGYVEFSSSISPFQPRCALPLSSLISLRSLS